MAFDFKKEYKELQYIQYKEKAKLSDMNQIERFPIDPYCD